MVGAVKALGLETCATLGMLKRSAGAAPEVGRPGLLQPQPRHRAGVLRQDHPRADSRTAWTRSEQRARRRHEDLLRRHRRHGRDARERAGLLRTLANLPEHPTSVPINRLVQVEGTPLPAPPCSIPSSSCAPSPVARLTMPASMVRLSAGRAEMSDELQALCFLAGANSIFYGEKLLTTGSPDVAADQALFARLGIRPLECRTSGHRACRHRRHGRRRLRRLRLQRRHRRRGLSADPR